MPRYLQLLTGVMRLSIKLMLRFCDEEILFETSRILVFPACIVSLFTCVQSLSLDSSELVVTTSVSMIQYPN